MADCYKYPCCKYLPNQYLYPYLGITRYLLGILNTQVSISYTGFAYRRYNNPGK